MKKGRHRRFEEARKLKQSGPSAFDLGIGSTSTRQRTADEDEDADDQYAALAEKYGYVDEDDSDDELDD
jgi:hypothetical protein